jgi:molybdopterin converting factor subunit 1
MPTITVRLFASARERAGKDRVSLSMPPGCTVGGLRRELARLEPALAPLLEKSAIAVNRRYADGEQLIAEGDEVAIIPPVAGG